MILPRGTWEPNPFIEPDFLMLSERHFKGYAETTLVVSHDNGTFAGVLPIIRFDNPRIPPRMVARNMGLPAAVWCLGTPLVDLSRADAAMAAILEGLRHAAKTENWPGIVRLDWVGDDGPVMACLRRVCDSQGLPLFTKETWERGIVHRDGRWEHPLGKTRRRRLASYRRALSRDTGTEVTLVERTLDPSVVDDFLHMEMTGWKGREGGLAFAKDDDKIAWFREWYERWSAAGRLVVLSLQAGDVPVAIEFFVRAGAGIFCFRGAYDDAYRKYSPGAIVLVECMEYLLKHTDALWMDSSTDKDSAFLLEFLPERRRLSGIYIGVGGVLDRRIVAALPTMNRFVATQRRLRER